MCVNRGCLRWVEVLLVLCVVDVSPLFLSQRGLGDIWLCSWCACSRAYGGAGGQELDMAARVTDVVGVGGRLSWRCQFLLSRLVGSFVVCGSHQNICMTIP